MPTMLGFLVGTAVACGLAILVVPLSWAAFTQALDNAPRLPRDPWFLLAGMLIGLVSQVTGRPSLLFRAIVHESAHALACLVLFVPIRGFMASRTEGGFVQHVKTGPIRTVLILIAPYVLPLLLAPPLIVAFFQHQPSPWREIVTAWCGGATIVHVGHLLWNMRHNWWGKESDLRRIGWPLSLILIALAAIWIGVAWLAILC